MASTPSLALHPYQPQFHLKWKPQLQRPLNTQHFRFNLTYRLQFHHMPISTHTVSLQLPILSNPNDSLDTQTTTTTNNSNIGIDDMEESLTSRVFAEEPPWISNLNMNGFDMRLGLGVPKEKEINGFDKKLEVQKKGMDIKKYNLLRRRQVEMETEAWKRTVEEYKEMEKEMCAKKLAPSLPYVKSLFLGWFHPLKEAIEKEQKFQREKRRNKAPYAAHLQMLPADKMAVIVMHRMMSVLLHGDDDRCVRVLPAAVNIGEAIEQEVRILSFFERTKKSRRGKNIEGDVHDADSIKQETLRKRIKELIKRQKLNVVQKLVKIEDEPTSPWGRDAQAKLGSRLIELLIETAFVQSPVDQLSNEPPEILPAFRHTYKSTTKERRRMHGHRYGVIECDPLVIKGLERTARYMMIPYVPMLIPPRKWTGYVKGGHLFLPSYVMRTHGSKEQKDAVKSVPRKQMQKVFEALDTLGRTKWRVNKRVFGVVENIWIEGGDLAGMVNREDVPIPEEPLSEEPMEIQAWKWNVSKAKRCNHERHAQRCDIELKLSVARKMKDEEGFYYPHSLDFRGRAYPMHAHLNHLSSDLCRGVLEFAEGRPLGKSGLRWLKIHLANLYAGGVEKLSYDGRLSFVENHLSDVLDSAEKPMNGKRWWLNAEDPFQCLAACINLSEAVKSSLPHTVISHMPIHQDGSCNGLQHYAALGRHSLEAAAVNLVAGEKPADVYSGIAARVLDIMKKDCQKDPATYPSASLARILVDQVDRKLVKQTVMTSVYGVTYIGAREQIKRRLMERGHITDDRLLFRASCYAATVTMTALEEMFQAARSIMDWLGDCAKVIASANQPVRWTTPLGLPVVQPYRKTRRQTVRTALQVLTLRRDGDSVELKKQRTAFPPNFVHSLDGTHMMMTAVACRDAGLHFAGVHDSFWTHACDVDQMNTILREKFVELYNMRILENLLEDFQKSYPTLKFPPFPDRGDFDLENVLESTYFFN